MAGRGVRPGFNKGTIMADKKETVCKKVYIAADGNETRSAQPDADRIEFRFGNGNTHVVKLAAHPVAIRTCLGWFGISEKYGNAYAGVGGDADDAETKFLSMQEQLMAGTWVEKADAGPRPSLIADAIIAALVAVGEKVDEGRAATIREKVKDKSTREGALNDPVIKAQYEAIKSARAAERAKDAAKKAKGETMSVGGF